MIGTNGRRFSMSADVQEAYGSLGRLIDSAYKSEPYSPEMRNELGRYNSACSYAERVARMLSSDKSKTFNVLNGNEISAQYTLLDSIRLYFTKAVSGEKVAAVKQGIDKRICGRVMENFCRKYDVVLKELEPRRASAREIYETTQRAHDSADIESRRYAASSEKFKEFGDKLRIQISQKRTEMDEQLKRDPSDPGIRAYSNDIIALESSLRNANTHACACMAQSESCELLRGKYELSRRESVKLLTSLNFIWDTTYANLVQFKALVNMHNSIGDAEDFKRFFKAVAELADKTSQLEKLYYDNLPRESELKGQLDRCDRVGSGINEALLSGDVAALEGLEARLKRMAEIHGKPREV